ncbi:MULTISPECIES: META and DUF4377 domain-containing protein [Chromobacterium]|uniref:DUF4377 domain-containing protein n=1 Tax=Chromobacterium rhizoryzae TaxID=1778675 RepID=A0AAD0RVJ3_9NEIS|nr:MULTISPECIES: META and DUF4377 domain-containing protein [Chromobacterium]AXT48944.1 DUF4377 domain-containing protein [Chromobacterium rhizoryzae]MDH0343687.1 META and DUF4377 domain-containing protein [Chromobacterium haemolyticum]OQS35373.1 hypothetical protein B0T40_13130 [Chromobacterium haemolyticum]PTU68098.1 DUF4377 domain-containing protein [Chromobacterium haemolyticum]QOD82894.1 META and DUF4377 domain-containing protein [Chromobacterium haemolyticum]
MKKSLLLAALTAAALSACATPQTGAKMDAQAEIKLDALAGQWKQAAAEHPITLSFKDGGVSARAGCNGMFGPVSLEGGQLVSKQLASTLMMCPPEAMERDRALAAFLGAKPAVKLDGDKLTLQAGDKTLSFERQPSLEGGVTRFVYVAAERKPCTGVAPMQCLQIRESKDQPWQLHYGEIEGFKPEPGIAYRLRLKEFKVENPPADASSIRWVLDMVVEQEVVKK